MDHALAQCAMGPRPPGSEEHRQTADYISAALDDAGWRAEVDEFDYRGVALRNIVARRGQGPLLSIGAHYDTRFVADHDPDPERRSEPIVGANDGASGVAVLLELARVLDADWAGVEVALTFFDAEDQGGAAGWEWFIGSTRIAEEVAMHHRDRFAGLVLVDMVGDLDQRVCRASDSTPRIADPIFAAAAELGYGPWLPSDCRYYVSDDHTPFLNRGLPAIDMIDFDYPHWHTHEDVCNKIGPEPLERVGRTIELWVEDGATGSGPEVAIADD
jgi:hypothetical protein